MRTPRPPVERSGRRDAVAKAIVAFRRIIRVLRLSAQRTQQASGISAAQMYVLSQLRDGTPLSLNQLAEKTLTDRTSVAEVVSRLRERKLVHRVAAATDRRRAAISLTDAGRALLRRSPSSGAPLLPALESLDARALAQLARGLTTLAKALNADAERSPFVFNDEFPQSPGARGRKRKPRRSG